MENEQWPFNGKSIWASLRPGQQCAAIVGVPIIWAMMQAFILLTKWAIPWPSWTMARAVLCYFAFFVLPWVYVRGIGIFIAVLFELIFVRRR